MKKPALLGFLLLSVPVLAQAQFSASVGPGGCTITGYFGSAGTLTIPTNLGGYTVTGIGPNIFQNNFSVTNVVVPGTVTNISAGAFGPSPSLRSITVSLQNTNYTSVNGVLFDHSQANLIEYPGALAGGYTVPGTVTNIVGEAFYYCQRLANVTLPDSVLAIGTNAFINCTMLSSITIPAGVTSIGAEAFFECTRLTNVAMTTGLSSIGASAFFDTALAGVTIPASVTNIGQGAFSSCPFLTSIAMAAPNAFYSSLNGVLFDSDQDTLINYPDGLGGSYTIPNGVTTIAGSAFWGAAVTNVTIPPGLTTIANSAFSESDVVSLMIPASVSNINEQALAQCLRLTSIVVDPGNSFYSSAGGVLFDHSQATLLAYPAGLGPSYIIPGSVSSIGPYAFQTCVSLSNVTIPPSVTSIGDDAFGDCGLTNVTIPAGVTNMGNYAFSCNLTNATFSDGLTSIGAVAFFASGLVSVSIPASVTNIGASAFAGCTHLVSATLANGLVSIGEEAFDDTAITNITIPASVSSIGLFAFVFCDNLGGVYFAGNAPSTDPSAFASDSSAVAYYLAGTTGWSAFSSSTGVPSVLWNPSIQTGGGNFGVNGNQFGFNINGTSNIQVVVQASTNLGSPVWVPVQTVTLTNGSNHFSDPNWSNYPGRFYRLTAP